MIRILVITICAAVCAANTVPMYFQEQWRDGAKRYVKGNCTVNVPSQQQPGKWNMRMKLDKNTKGIQIWRMNVINRKKGGKEYNLQNKDPYNGITPITFIIEYRGNVQPTGKCISAFDGNAVEEKCSDAQLQATQSMSVNAMQFQEKWQDGRKRYIKGNCTITLPEYQRTGRWSMRLVFDKMIKSVQIWRMRVLNVTRNGKEYNLKNKHPYSGVTPVTFILQYRGNREPTGQCVSAFNGNPVSEICEDDLATTTTSTTSTAPSSTTTTSTAPSSTTTTSTLATSTTPQTTTTTIPTTTPIPATHGTVVPVNTSAAWSVGTHYKMEGHCTFPISTPMSKFFVQIDFDKPTSALSEWHVSVVRKEASGLWYYTENKAPASTPKIDFNFHIDYYSEPHPQGTCTLLLPGNPTPTSMPSTSSASSQGTTVNPTTQIPTTTVPPTQAPSTSNPSTASPVTTTKGPSSSLTTSSIATSSAASTTSSSASTTSSSPATTPSVTTTIPVTVNTKYDYNEVLHKSILFYEAQRSGRLPADNRIPYRGDSSVDDQGEFGEDLSGGWHDAGDHVKFNFPMASSTTLLSLGLYFFRDAYTNAGELNYMFDSIKWPLDYFIKCWREDAADLDASRYYATIGDPDADHAFWGRPEDMTMARPAYYIDSSRRGSDVGAETAAALTAGALAFESRDLAYATSLLERAKSLYEFSKRHRGIYSDAIPKTQGFYRSSGDRDELCESAVLLYMATKDPSYLADAQSFYSSNTAWSLSWDEKTALCQVLLLRETGDSQYKAPIIRFLHSYINGSVHRTPCGLSWRLQWGSLRYTANAAYIALLAAETGEFTDQESYDFKRWAMSQIHYMLGDNKYDRSYVVGFGNNPPQRPHHRAASCPSSGPCGNNELSTPNPNPQVLFGALVGGPNQNDDYADVRTDFIANEVATDYNAGFQSAVAALQSFALNDELPPAPTPKSC